MFVKLKSSVLSQKVDGQSIFQINVIVSAKIEQGLVVLLFYCVEEDNRYDITKSKRDTR